MATWLDRGRYRVVLSAVGEVEHFMKIHSPPGVVWSGANDGTVTPNVAVAVEAWPDNVRGKVYGSAAACKTAMELDIDLAETTAILDAMDDPPSPAERIDINLLTLALLPLFSKFAVFYVSAAHTRQAGRVNWVDPGTFTAKEMSGPLFINNRGFSSDPDRVSFVSTTFDPAVEALVMARDDAHVGVYVTNNANATDLAVCGNSKTFIMPRANNSTMRTRGNTDAFTSTIGGIATSGGHSLWTRSDAGSYLVYKDGASIATINHASQALVSEELCFGGLSYDPNPDQIVGAFHAGSALTSQEVSTINTALDVYMQARGY